MNDLQKLVSGIVNDLISARYEADAVAAEYTKLYRDDPLMQNMNAPMLNISNVVVDLRLAFAPPEEDKRKKSADAASDLKKEVTEKEIRRLRDRMFDKTNLPHDLSGAKLTGAKRAMTTRLAAVLESHANSRPLVREAAMAERIHSVLDERNVKLSKREMAFVDRDIKRTAAKIATTNAISSAVGDGRKIITDTETLEKINPEAISSIKFDVNLDPLRWIDVQNNGEDEDSVLSSD